MTLKQKREVFLYDLSWKSLFYNIAIQTEYKHIEDYCDTVTQQQKQSLDKLTAHYNIIRHLLIHDSKILN